MKSFAVLCLLGIFLATAFAVQVPIHIENDGDDATRVRVTVSNPSTQHSLVLTPYGSPLAIDSAASFAVTDVDSATVLDYTGAVFKRVWPPADDSLVVVAPQQSYSRVVDLTAGYDLEAGRSYAVAVHASAAVRGMFVDEAQQRRSVDGQLGELFAASSSALPLFEAQRAQPVLMRPQASSTPFGLQQASAAHVARADQAVNCGTPSQNDFITQAIALSRQQTDWAKQFVDNGCQGSGYTTWFGTVTTNRYNIVHDCVTNINALLKSDYGVKWIVDCGGPCDPGVYAYVYPSQTAAPKRIYVCSAFWTAATTWPAEDSNGGVFIHEASHFNDICATDDHVYGSSGAKALAISNPAQAVNNADNYEYFAEAKPTICSSTTTASASTSASTSASGTTSATTSASGTTSATTSASGTTSATTSASGTTSATTTVSRTTTTTNNNGGGGSSSGCFAASSRVRVQLDDGSVVSKQLRDVQVGDKLESVDADFKAVFSDVYAVLHKDDERAVPMLQLTLAHNAGAVKLTAHHLILAAADAASWRLVDAASVKPGDYLLASAGPRRVVDVRPFTDAVRAPLTLNDRIVVDGVAASAFAHSETLYSPLTAPLKLAYALAPSALASSPVQSLIDTVVGWTDAFEQRVAVAPASF